MTDTDLTNAKRAAWAEAAIHLFTQITGCDREDALGDLLGDLMHWAERHSFDFELALSRAKGHFEEEQEDERRLQALYAAPEMLEALLDIKLLASKHGDSGCEPHALLELIEEKVVGALASVTGAAQ